MAPVARDDGGSTTPTDPPPEEGELGRDESVPPPRASGQKRRRDPMIGRTVAGRFRIRSVIARGGMGKVYRAEQVPLGRDCAVKILNPKYEEDDPEFRRRFFLEASTASKLTHANTVTIFDYGEDEGIFYIAMEYVAGRTLFRVLREDGPLEEPRVAGIIGEVARSLREAHGIGVIHRDMKPANIVLSESQTDGDSIKVLDFGLVKHVEADEGEDLTQQGLFMGSPKYMAPEQILGNPVSPATDIYALGVVAYELLTGKVPFDRGSSVKTLMAHVNDAPPPLYETNPDVTVSPEMTAVVMRCIEKDPKHRYASVDGLLRELSRVAGGGPMVESLLRMRKVTVPAEGITGLPEAEKAPNRRLPRHRRSDPEADTAPTRTGATPDVAIADPVSAVDESTSSERRPFVGQTPSGTPEPMSQAVIQRASLDDVELRPVGRGKVIGVLAAVVALLVAGTVVVTSAPESEGIDLTQGADSEGSSESGATDRDAHAPAAPAPEADAPRLRVVRVTSEPPGAQVRAGDEVLCGATPCEISFRGDEAAASHEVTFRKAGYGDTTVSLAPDAESLEGALRRIPGRPPGPAPKADPPAPTPKPDKSLPGYKDSPY